MSDDTALHDAAQILYAVAPEQFVATRSALVAQAKGGGNAAAARQIARLRRPSVAAWALNHLVHTDPDTVAELLGLGVRMRGAQGALDLPALQALRVERDRIVDTVVTAAAFQADTVGRALSPAVRDEIRATSVAALADAAAADALASGALSRALSYSGFGEVDISDAVVRTTSGNILSVLPGGAPATTGSTSGDQATADGIEPGVARPSPRALARAALDDAEGELAAAAEDQRACERDQIDAQSRVEEAAHLLVQAQQRVERTQAALVAAQAAFTLAARRHRLAERARHSAAAALQEAPAES